MTCVVPSMTTSRAEHPAMGPSVTKNIEIKRFVLILLVLGGTLSSCTTVHRSEPRRLKTEIVKSESADRRPVFRLDTNRRDLLLESKLPLKAYWEREESLFDVIQTTTNRRTETIAPGKVLPYVLFDLLQIRWAVSPFTGLFGPAVTGDPRWFYTLPPIDFFGRLAGDGLRRNQKRVFKGKDTAPEKMESDYALNLLDWFGWFLPGYPVYASRTRQSTSEKGYEQAIERIEFARRWVEDRPMTQEEFSTLRLIANGRLIGEDNDVIVSKGTQGSELTVDLRKYLVENFGRDDTILLEVASPVGQGDAKSFAAFGMAAREIGVVWQFPTSSPKPSLELASEIVDADGNRLKQPKLGEEFYLKYKITNSDSAFAARNLTTELMPQLGESLSSRLAVASHRIERLDPGQTWSITYPVRIQRASTTARSGDHSFSFDLKMTDQYSNSWNMPLRPASIELPPPAVLRIKAEDIGQIALDKGRAGFLDAGDRVLVQFTVENVGGLPAEACTIEGALSIPGVGPLREISVSPSYVGDIAPNAAVKVFILGSLATAVKAAPGEVRLEYSLALGQLGLPAANPERGTVAIEAIKPSEEIRAETLVAEVEHLRQQLSSTQGSLASQDIELSALRRDRSDLEIQLKNTREQFERETASQANELANLQEQRRNTTEELVSARKALDEATRKLLEQATQSAEARKLSGNYREQEEIQRKKESERQIKESARLEQELERLANEVRLGEQRYQDLEVKLFQLSEKAELDARDRNDKLAKLESDNQLKIAQILQVERERDVLLSASNKLTVALNDANIKIEKLTEDLRRAEAQSSQRDRELSEATRLLQSGRAELTDARAKLGKLGETLKRDLNTWKQELALLRSYREQVRNGLVERRANSRALIIGVNDYSGLIKKAGYQHLARERWNLRYATTDAERIRALITDPDTGFVNEDRVIMLTDLQATEDTLRKVFREIETECEAPGPDLDPKRGILFVYFAGHGFQSQLLLASSLWNPADTEMLQRGRVEARDLRYGSSIADFQDWFSVTNYLHEVMVIDACDMGMRRIGPSVPSLDSAPTSEGFEIAAVRSRGAAGDVTGTRAVGRPQYEEPGRQAPLQTIPPPVSQRSDSNSRRETAISGGVLMAEEGSGFLLASGHGKPALELERLQAGLFTHLFTDIIRAAEVEVEKEHAAGMWADRNHDGVLIVEEVLEALKYQMASYADDRSSPLSPDFIGAGGMPLAIPLAVGPSAREEYLKEQIASLEDLLAATR